MRMISKENIDYLKSLTGPKGWISGDEELAPYVTEWRGKYHGKTPLMLQPDTTEKVKKILTYCNDHTLPVVTQGGNTGLVGGSTPGLEDRSEILLSLKRMNSVDKIDTQNNTLIAGAGTVIAEIQNAAKEKERLFPLSLASEGSCTLGGTIATNAGGVHVIRYGTMRNLVMGIEAVMPNGYVFNSLRPLKKDNTGYDLTNLLVGSEGTLGVITRATVCLLPEERNHQTLWLCVRSLTAANNVLASIKDTFPNSLSVFEIMSAECIRFALDHIPGTKLPAGQPSPWHILVELADHETVSNLPERTHDWLENNFSNLLTDGAVAQSSTQRSEFWHLRECLSEAQKKEGASIKHDISLPIDAIPDFHRVASKRILEKYPGVRITPFGHLGDGNLHYNIMQPAGARSADYLQLWQDMNELVHDTVTEFNGSISAEHGIGTMKRMDLVRAKGQNYIDIMKDIKKAFDPNNILNPGVFFEH